MNDFKKIPRAGKLHIALGAFDGVHCAHGAVIRCAVEAAQRDGGKSLVLSFEPLPKEYFQHEVYPGRLLPAYVKETLLKGFGADAVITASFAELCAASERDFMEGLLTRAEELHFYAGRDFRVGSKDGARYEGENVFIHHQDEILVEGHACRSTEIRSLVRTGDMQGTAGLLGREYVYYSRTVHGNRVGRGIDFPTVNLAPTNQVLPQSGVYFGELCIYGKTFPSAVYVGTRPTLNGDHIRIEAHSVAPFPETDTPSHTEAAVRFVQKIFEEKGFESLAKLREMLYNYRNVSSALAAERYKNHPAPPLPGCRPPE